MLLETYMGNIDWLIRLDVYKNNDTSINLYKKCGFKYVDTVDLGIGIPELVWFKLYELIIL